MAYLRITHWDVAGRMDDILESAQRKYVGLILAEGASAVQMVRTGEMSLCVISHYEDEASFLAAKSVENPSKDQAVAEFPVCIHMTFNGEVFASG